MKIVETLPAASPRMGFFKAVAGWLDAAMVEFGPEGTMHYLQGSIAGRTDRLYTTGIKEQQIIFGDTGPLEQAIRDIDKSVAPQLLFVSSSPVSEIIGVDIETVVWSVQPTVRAKLFAWDRVPVEGTEAQGYAAAHEKAAEYLRQNPAWGSQGEKSGCLILGLNETDWSGAADLNELRRMMEAYFGLYCWNDKDGRYCLSDIPKAQCLLVIAPEAVPLAKTAEELWGTIWYECVPYGLAACEELVSALERLLKRQAAPCWTAERREVGQSLAQFQMMLKQQQQKNVFLDARKARCPAWEAFLTKELGLTVSRPSADHPALSTDGSVDHQPGLLTSDLLLGSGLLCAMYPEHPSLCIEYPTAGQKLLSHHIPMMGMWGAENVAAILSSIIKNRHR